MLRVHQDGETFYVQPEGSDERLEVDLGGYVGPEQLKAEYVSKARFQSEIKRRIGTAKAGVPEPELKERLERLTARAFVADFATAARQVGLDDEIADVVQEWLRAQTAYHEESDAWVVVDDDGEPKLTSADVDTTGRTHPYQTVEDLLRDIEAKGDRKSWFKARQKTGGDLRPGGTGTVTLEEWDRMDDGARASLYGSDRQTWQSMIDATRKRGEGRLLGVGA
jgi:hypothetical protein